MNDDENKTAPENALEKHPLLDAFHNMAKMAVTNKGLKVLARIEHGINNRMRWIESRQSQIDRLQALTLDVLAAYDAGDNDLMNRVLIEVEQIVNMSEGVSAAEAQIGEVLDETDDVDDGFPPPHKLPFKSKRKTYS